MWPQPDSRMRFVSGVKGPERDGVWLRDRDPSSCSCSFLLCFLSFRWLKTQGFSRSSLSTKAYVVPCGRRVCPLLWKRAGSPCRLPSFPRVLELKETQHLGYMDDGHGLILKSAGPREGSFSSTVGWKQRHLTIKVRHMLVLLFPGVCHQREQERRW